MKSTNIAAEKIREIAVQDDFIRIVSHHDADGISAAAIITKALSRLNATFRGRIEKQLDDKLIKMRTGNPFIHIIRSKLANHHRVSTVRSQRCIALS